ncbi:MAG: hypothetical protein INR65_02210 [Gluconacetobacter diazotrophicus]|nr:hypothetical protein [Gluconacetobacter diazotrophicus]
MHGERLADHMAAMIEAARARAETMERQAESVLRANRTARTLSQRVREAVLALIGAEDAGDWINGDLPLLLGVDGASLCVEGGSVGRTELPVRAIPRGTVAALLGRAEVRLRDAPADAALLHGEAAGLARFDALVRVPVEGAGAMLLALASRDDPGWNGSATGNGGCEDLGSLGFLGAAIGARVGALVRATAGRIGGRG